MYITSFWAKNYRSLRDIRIDGMGPFNVFYGRNGTGKSNILAGLDTLFGFLAARTDPGFTTRLDEPATNDALRQFLPDHERCLFQRFEPVVLGAVIQLHEGEIGPAGSVPPHGHGIALEVVSDAPGVGFRVSRVAHGPSEDEITLDWLGILKTVIESSRGANARQRVAWLHDLSLRAFGLVHADRGLYPEKLGESATDFRDLAGSGRIKELLFRARNHRNGRIRRRYKQLQELLADEPLRRRPFEPVYDPGSGQVDVMEYLDDSVDEPKEVPLDLAGLGISQIYSILAQIMFCGTYSVAIEEPEAHLHAPTTGMHLRQLLQRLVEKGYIKQLFIATHSNLFDLDPGGYFDVELEPELGTVVTREKALSKIDLDHLYEPGPAKHALADYLRYLEPEDVVFRKPDGSPVSVAEMLDMLQRDDPLAKAFLEDVHGAAVRAVRVKSKRRNA